MARVILVTNNYHMPRSLLEMGRLLAQRRAEPYPVVNTRLDGGGWLTKPEALRVLFTEYNKYLAALAPRHRCRCMPSRRATCRRSMRRGGAQADRPRSTRYGAFAFSGRFV